MRETTKFLLSAMGLLTGCLLIFMGGYGLGKQAERRETNTEHAELGNIVHFLAIESSAPSIRITAAAADTIYVLSPSGETIEIWRWDKSHGNWLIDFEAKYPAGE